MIIAFFDLYMLVCPFLCYLLFSLFLRLLFLLAWQSLLPLLLLFVGILARYNLFFLCICVICDKMCPEYEIEMIMIKF